VSKSDKATGFRLLANPITRPKHEFDPEQLAAMDLAEYSKHRSRLLGSSGGNRGMFGN
jgi:hypothetical protein